VQDAIEPLSRMDTLAMVMTRVNHIEALLNSSLFGFLMTAGAAGFGAVYTVRSDRAALAWLKAGHIFVAMNLVLALLSMNYYFMLAQMYGGVVVGLQLTSGQGLPIDALWTIHQLPFTSERIGNTLVLLHGPALPFIFTVLVLGGFWFLLRQELSTARLRLRSLALSVTLHAGIAAILTAHPFATFLRATWAWAP